MKGAMPGASRSLGPRVIVAATGVVIVVIAGFAVRGSTFDLFIDQALNAFHHGWIGTLTDAVYVWAGPLPAVVVTAILTGVILLVRRDLRTASTFAVTIAVTWIPSAIVKMVVARPRPDIALLTHPPTMQHDASYPSGHAVFLTALVVAAIAVTRSRALRRLWATLGAVGIVLLTLSLLTDGLHYPSDIFASLIWSLTLAPLIAAIWWRLVRRRESSESPGRPSASTTSSSADDRDVRIGTADPPD